MKLRYHYPVLCVTDLHLTANPSDEYRWSVFENVRSLVRRSDIKAVFILGDITDAKDYHSATLVNRMVKEVTEIAALVPVLILRGNHDYLKEGHSFFEFFNYMNLPITFVTENTEAEVDGDHLLFIPHTKNFLEDNKDVVYSDYDYVFIHQTVSGFLSENGTVMENSLTIETFKSKHTKVFAGDLHQPQVIGNVTYIGSPYPVRYGDNFTGRCLILDTEVHSFKEFKNVKRASIHAKGIDDFFDKINDLEEGDSVKVVLTLMPHEKSDWFSYKSAISDYCKANKITLAGLAMKASDVKRITVSNTVKVSSQKTPDKVLSTFAEIEALGGELLDVGLSLLESQE